MNGQESEYNDNTVPSWNERASFEYDGKHFKSQDVMYQALSGCGHASKSHFIVTAVSAHCKPPARFAI